MTQKSSLWQDTLKGFFFGSTANVIVRTVQYPFVRSHLYAMGILNYNEKPVRGVLDFYMRIIKSAGISELYKGYVKHMLSLLPPAVVTFTTFEAFRSLFSNHVESPSVNYYSGGIAGILTTIIFSPKYAYTNYNTYLQRNNENRKTFVQFLQTTKLTELYRNIVSSSITAAFYRGLYFGFYFNFNKKYNDSNNTNNTIKRSKYNRINNYINKSKTLTYLYNFSLSWATTFLAGISTYWADTVHRRLRIYADANPRRYFFDIAKEIYKKEGFKSFFKGGVSSFTRGLTPAMIIFLYDALTK